MEAHSEWSYTFITSALDADEGTSFPTALPSRRKLPYQLNRRLARPQSQSRRYGGQKYLLATVSTWYIHGKEYMPIHVFKDADK
jgi:hypothetical protein